MPEYLAPGVYVEETSFRSKSIEGVGTSTTAFVGPTLKGPAHGTPDLITSFADFERLYGGLGDLAPGRPNYLAHAVKVFFDNGGSRLYVSRVVPGSATPGQSDELLPVAPAPPTQLRFRARFPGPGGNGVIEIMEKATPVSLNTLVGAPAGSLLRIGGETVATPAQLNGSLAPPFSLPNGGLLFLAINGSDTTVTFRGRAAEVVATADLDDPLVLAPGIGPLEVRIGGGVTQRIPLPSGNPVEVQSLLGAINQQLQGGYARLDGKKLVLGTDQRGSAARLQVVGAPAALKLPVILQTNTADANNNVADLAAVSLAEINALLPTGANGVTATIVNGSLALRTTRTGVNQELMVRDRAVGAASADPISVHGLLGLPTNPVAVQGTAGEAQQVYRLINGEWRDQQDGRLNLNQTPFPIANLLTLSLLVRSSDGQQTLVDDLGYCPDHPRWIGAVLKEKPDSRADALSNPVALVATNPQSVGTVNGLLLRQQLLTLAEAGGANNALAIPIQGGLAGGEATAADYELALEPLKALEEISIVAAPGHSAHPSEPMFIGIQEALISFVSRRRAYQIAVLDPPQDQDLNGVRQVRSRIDSKYAALYYPWVVVANPLYRPGDARQPAEISLPPSGFLCGIYGRNDSERGVFKAPANEVVLGALRFERDINFAQQEVLNPLGINCLRFFPGRGYRVWGARTASSDPEFKYVNVRRYFNYLEASIDRSTQWAVFEPNSERLWSNIRDTISSFLYTEWVSGALLGGSIQEAYFVRCDRSTMTQNDLDNGRLICLIGVAVVKPAEFVIFRIGQKTADARS